MTGPGRFLTAQWRHLAMLNYAVDPEVLAPHVPAGTELDSWQGNSTPRVHGTRTNGICICFDDTYLLSSRSMVS